jgi:hypothetical protein
MFQTTFVEEFKTHFMFSKYFENLAVYEIMWKNIERSRPQMTIRRMRTACWIQTHTQNMQYLLLFRYNNSHANAPRCYVIRKLPACYFYCCETPGRWRIFFCVWRFEPDPWTYLAPCAVGTVGLIPRVEVPRVNVLSFLLCFLTH